MAIGHSRTAHAGEGLGGPERRTGPKSSRSVRFSWGRSVALRLILLAAGLAGLAALRIPHRPPTLCLLRSTTGIPCPFCGFTTAGVQLGHADVIGAVAASPLAVLTCVGFVALPLLRRSPLAARWARFASRQRQLVPVFAILPILSLAEIGQLIRFGVL